jgi:hypothetical protein
MNTELYEKWIESRQVESDGIDIADAVMSRITEKVYKTNVIKQTCESVLLDLMQAKMLVRTCVLASGALMGMIRIALQIYSALFI